MPLRRLAVLLILFSALTAVVTYPQITGMRTLVPFHSDPYFSMWRLGWVAHQIPHGWTGFFEGNIFFPEHHTLAYSDAMLLPGILLAPFFWIGVSSVTIYNCALLAAMALSGVAMWVLVQRLTGSDLAGIVGGAIYAFAPYRFDHYMHLELQIVFWLPLALLVMHRSVETARPRDAMMLGALVAAQALSCVYVGLFFATYSLIFAPALLMLGAAARRWRTLGLWVAAGIFAAVLTAPYALAYSRAQESVGTRTADDVRHYGATMWSYRATPPMNRLFGREGARPGTNELYLFPGYMALFLAGVGLVCRTIAGASCTWPASWSRSRSHGVSTDRLFRGSSNTCRHSTPCVSPRASAFLSTCRSRSSPVMGCSGCCRGSRTFASAPPQPRSSPWLFSSNMRRRRCWPSPRKSRGSTNGSRVNRRR